MRINKIITMFIASLFCFFSILVFTSCGVEIKVICTYDGQTFDWSDVESSKKYKVNINDGSENTEEVSVAESQYEYDVQGGTVDLNLSAEDADGNVIYTSEVPFTFTSLGVFETPTYDKGVISWNPVSSATHYLVKIGNKVETTTNTYFELNPGINNDVCVKPVLDISKVEDGKYYTYSVSQSYEIMATPVIASFDKNTKTITWNSVNNAGGYYLRIELDGQMVAEQAGIGAAATYYDDYPFAAVGTYTVKFAATANSNSNSYDSKFAEKTIVRLAAPTNLTVEDSNGTIVVKWDAVQGANKYRIVLPDGSSVETTELFYKYIPESLAVEQNFKFKVYATSTDPYTLDSVDCATDEVVKLGIVRNVKIQGQRITWDLVDKAQGYIVSVDGTEVNVDKNEYYFDGYTGSHQIKVQAKGNGQNIISSNFSEVQTIYKLSKPKDLLISNGVLTWSPVTNASSYNIILTNGNSGSNEGSYSSTTNSITINRSELKETQTIQVQAMGDGLTIADSAFSEPYNTYVLAAPVVSVSLEGIVWEKINNAVSYTVHIGPYVKRVTGTALNLSEEDIPANTYTVVVVANGDLVHYFDSEESQAISVKLLAAPNVRVNDDLTGISWNTVISASDYQVRVDSGQIENLGQAIKSHEIDFTTSGTHTVSLRAVGDGIQTVTSAWSTIQVETKQVGVSTGFTVEKVDDKLIITATEVDNAAGYKFRIGGAVFESETKVYEYTVNNPGDFVIAVAAKGTGFMYIDGSFSAEQTVTVLNTPASAYFVKEDDTLYLLTWSPVNKAVSYIVEVTKTYSDGEVITETVTVAKTELQIDVTDVVSMSAKITVKGDNVLTFSSLVKYVEAVAIE